MGAELASYIAGRIAQQLAASGILVSDLLCLRDAIRCPWLWDSLGNDGKLVLQESVWC